MEKSTATVTWLCHRNFGTLLQAYALQRTLISLGYQNRVIDDSIIINAFPKKKFSPLRLLRNIGWLFPKRSEFRRHNDEVIRLYDDFKNKFINIDREWTRREELSERYDVFIAGSDQIWSPAVPFDDFYYLNFTDRPKVAYGPSLGVSSYPNDRVQSVKPLLERFSVLSVREPRGATILREKFGLNAAVVSDPTMLLEKDEWAALSGQTSSETKGIPYALCYFLTYNKEYMDSVSEYCSRNSLRMKIMVVSSDLVGAAEEEVYTGPIGFLEEISGAEVVFTDSFHGTIFSLIFEKAFYTFKRFADSSVISQNSRVENLLCNFDLLDRLGEAVPEKFSSMEIDWTKVRESASNMREASLKYLKDSLSII